QGLKACPIALAQTSTHPEGYNRKGPGFICAAKQPPPKQIVILSEREARVEQKKSPQQAKTTANPHVKPQPPQSTNNAHRINNLPQIIHWQSSYAHPA
ncbi:MAG: hypothetical protein P4K80_07460, partial [Acidobacteriaceae bacterium]|nr:hypothetical protein [Acidobacteriaceae bacterium]